MRNQVAIWYFIFCPWEGLSDLIFHSALKTHKVVEPLWGRNLCRNCCPGSDAALESLVLRFCWVALTPECRGCCDDALWRVSLGVSWPSSHVWLVVLSEKGLTAWSWYSCEEKAGLTSSFFLKEVRGRLGSLYWRRKLQLKNQATSKILLPLGEEAKLKAKIIHFILFHF